MPDEPQDGQPPQEQPAPPWGDPEQFNPEKAWNLIQNLREENKGLKARPVLDDDAKARLAEYDQIVEASKTDLERAREDLTRWQTDAEKWRGAAVASTVKAIAATDFADPDDAVRNLDPARYLDASGTIDEAAIKADLGKLLEAKPHYRRATEPAGPRAPRPNPAQGSSGDGTNTSDPAQQFAGLMNGLLAR